MSHQNVPTPAWWCDLCRQWWPGSWAMWIDVGDGPPTPDDIEDAKPYWYRTCPECGHDLEPRTRPWRTTP